MKYKKNIEPECRMTNDEWRKMIRSPFVICSSHRSVAKTDRSSLAHENPCFVACTEAGGLLSIELRTAGRAPVSENSLQFHLSAGCDFRDRFKFDSRNADKNEFNALRNFSRESSAAQNSKLKSPRNQDAIAPNL